MKHTRNQKLPIHFYQREDVVQIAQDLIGKMVCTHIEGKFTSGMIVETEAYRAPEDKASHAFNHLKSKRTMPFYEAGGIVYTYLIYGVYTLFNIITSVQEVPHAVLIRAIEPKEGIDVMLQRRGLDKVKRNLTGGPGLTSMALGIEMKHNLEPITGNLIWIEDGINVNKSHLIASPRVGLGKRITEPYLSMPWRFRLKDNSFTSPAK